MKNITEITETDFRKLDLVGYRYEKMSISAAAHRMVFKEHHLNDVLDEEKKYVEENPEWEQTVAFFVTELPTEEEKERCYEAFQGIKDEDERRQAAYGMAMLNVSNFDKYYWNQIGTYTIWDGVRHIYSKRTKWVIDADSECGELHKKKIARIYIVHLGE